MSFAEFYECITQDVNELVEFQFTNYQKINEHYTIKLDGSKIVFITNMQSVECVVGEYDFATQTGYYYY